MKTDHQGNPKAISVLIVDDHPAVCQGLSLLLEPEGIAVCAEAGGLAEALAAIEQHQPDLVLVDLTLHDENGLALLTELRERNLPALVYSMHEEGSRVEGAFAAGASGYVTKREVHGVLVQAICEVVAGRRFVSPRAAVALANRAADGQKDGLLELSNQERQVYKLLGEACGTAEIALALKISTRTVESYYSRILAKLDLNGMRELRRHAVNHLHDKTL